MKTLLLSSVIFFLSACNHSSGPSIHFDTDTVNFGSISEGDTAISQFRFKNVGGEDLRIVNVGTSCNCSVVDFPKTLFAVDSTGAIIVKYMNARDPQTGVVSKTVVVETNCKPSIHVLTLMGTVNPKKIASL